MMAARTSERNNVRKVILFAVVCYVLLGTTKGEECEYFINSTQGYLESPNFETLYPNSIQCIWRFEAKQGSRMKLVLKILEVQPHQNCISDYVTVYDGHSIKDNLLGTFCGKYTVYTVITTTHRMLMVFHSDESQQFKGFQAFYSSGCNHLVNAPHGFITSPNYPNLYPPLQICIWEFQTTPGKRIKLLFDDFQLEHEYGNDCWFDFVAIYDGATTNDTLLGKYCGYNKIRPMISTSNRMLMVFYSDRNRVDTGFKASYSTEATSDTDEDGHRSLSGVNGNNKNIAKQSGCGFYTNTSSHVFVRSPNYSKLYPSSEDCIFRFETTPGNRCKLVFMNFELQQHENCSFDYVALYDGHSTNDTLLGKFCGSELPLPILSTGNKMLFVFHSDESQEYSGFQALYSIGCDYFVNATEGIVTSPNYPDGFPHYKICIWEFQTTPGRQIRFVFDDFRLSPSENCTISGFVALFDGATVNNPLLGKSCSNWEPVPIISTTHNLIIVFCTGGYRNERGFKATYSTGFFSALNSTIIGEIGKKLTYCLLNSRQKHTSGVSKWGLDITKIAVALFLHDPEYFAADNETGEEIAYELTLQLMSKLVLKKRISTKDLALFINAMTVACINPRNFFHVNVVAELRKRVDNSNHTNPFFILTLCNAGEKITSEYVQKLQPLLNDQLQSSLTEIQAMVIMAMKCILRQSNNDQDNTLTEMINELKMKQQRNGTMDNRKDAALIIQALIATESYRTNFNLSMAINSIIMDIKDMHLSTEEIYYILPVLKRKSLLDVSSDHCDDFVRTDLEVISSLREHSDERIQVQISIIIGNDMDFTRTWRIKVPSNYSFYQALEIISFSKPEYKIQYRSYDGKMYVTGLGNFQNSVADDSFWFIYTKPLLSDDDPILVKESPVDIQVKETDELILWYRSRLTANTEKSSSD